jgi:hypothetical protein
MQDETTTPEKKEEEKKFDAAEVLIEGCIDEQAKEVISQMLERRLAELDPTGGQAKFIMKLQNEINEMPSCKDLLTDEEKQQP